MARPGRLRRWVLRPAVWALAALALAIALARLFLASDFARERARDLLEARLADALERPVRIGRVDFSLLPLGLVVELGRLLRGVESVSFVVLDLGRDPGLLLAELVGADPVVVVERQELVRLAVQARKVPGRP